MRIKALAVITLFVLGCSAAFAQTPYTFGFLSASGVNEYCNYENFLVGPSSRLNFYMQGYDVLTVCPGWSGRTGQGASINGFAISIPAAAFAPVIGKAYVYSDQIFDAYYNGWTQEQWTVFTKTSVNKLNHFGNENWAGYVGFFGYEFLGNYGFLTTTIPLATNKGMLKSTVNGVNTAKLQKQIGK